MTISIARMIAADGRERANRGEAVSGEVVFDDACRSRLRELLVRRRDVQRCRVRAPTERRSVRFAVPGGLSFPG